MLMNELVDMYEYAYVCVHVHVHIHGVYCNTYTHKCISWIRHVDAHDHFPW